MFRGVFIVVFLGFFYCLVWGLRCSWLVVVALALLGKLCCELDWIYGLYGTLYLVRGGVYPNYK
jgi:hypothetical protein